MRSPISVAIITLNEERNSRACLESVKWADEIVVCDSGSTDRTLAIAAEYGACTFQDPWWGFAAHKNLVVEGRVGRLSAPLDHFTCDSISAFLQRMDRYSTLAAEELQRAGRSARLLDLLGRPVWTLLRMWLLQSAWREGWRGLVLSGLYAGYAFSKYAKLWEITGLARNG